MPKELFDIPGELQIDLYDGYKICDAEGYLADRIFRQWPELKEEQT